MFRPLILAFLLFGSPASWAQTTWFVPDDFATIQSAIDGSSSGDTVVVRDGNWPGIISFNGKRITLKSENGPAVTSIDGGGAGTVVTFANNETHGSVLEGFTVLNGAASKGGGAYFSAASPVVVDCVFRDNSATYGGGVFAESVAEPMFLACSFVNNNSDLGGGGVRCDYWSEPEFVDCLISDNLASNGDGGGVYCVGSSPTFLGTEISNNSAGGFGGGVSAVDYAFPILTNCLVVRNASAGSGGGLACSYGANLSVKRTTVAENTAGNSGGGLWAYFSDFAMKDCILWGNTAGPGLDGIDWPGALNMTVSYSCIQESQGQPWAGTGCIDADPLFVGGHYLRQVATGHLSDSPCVDAGVPTGPPSGTTRIDGGADIGQPDMGYHYPAGLSGPVLTVTNAVAGQSATIQVESCTPGGLVIAAYSLRGGGPINTPWGTGLLTPPYTSLPSITASGSGVAAWTVSVPSTASGVQAWLQALDFGAGFLSNGVALTVQ